MLLHASTTKWSFFQHKQCFHIAVHRNHKEDRVLRKVLFPFPIKRKDVLFLPNPTFASRQMDVKDPHLATFPFSLVHRDRKIEKQETRRNFEWNTQYKTSIL